LSGDGRATTAPPGAARALAALAFFALLAAPALAAEEPAPRRVLIISSFGSRFAPFDTFAAVLRTEIVRDAPGPVEFLEVPLEMARFREPPEEGPYVDYLRALVASRPLDLVVTVGGPAATLAAQHRGDLFASVPTLLMGLDRRQAPPAVSPNQVVVAEDIDVPGLVANILRLLPDTKRIVVALGNSPLERFWRDQAQREFAPFADRVAFEWFNGLTLEQMRRRAADLPAHSAILYGLLAVDAAGVPHEQDEGLKSLSSVANAPIFGIFEFQLGHGIVGGPLLSVERAGRRSADVALAILRGESPAALRLTPPVAPRDIFDWRELRRWNVREERLPSGSEVRFRPPSLWQAYRRALLAGLAILVLEALLIAGLLAERARRRSAEDVAHALNRRLLTAQEDERKRIARELHDDLSQRLARLSIDAARLEYAAAVPLDGGAPSPMRAELARLSEDVHALAYQLHPSTLDDLGLAEALKVECDRFSRLEAIPVKLDVPAGTPEPTREVALCLFRIAQEGLRNVARHARAASVELSFRANGDLCMTLRDDGVGFDPAVHHRRPSLGLAGMRERVELVGGKIDVRSAPGRGTAIEVRVPPAPPA